MLYCQLLLLQYVFQTTIVSFFIKRAVQENAFQVLTLLAFNT